MDADDEGLVRRDSEDIRNANSQSSVLHLQYSFNFGARFEFDFTEYCTFTTSSGCGVWPRGSYCILKYGNRCPFGFQEGNIYWDDEDSNNANFRAGAVPAGNYGRDTRIFYCCRSDGDINVPIVLPTERPFFLMRQSAAGCQLVAGMSVSLEWKYSDDEDCNNANSISGSIPYIEGVKDYRLYYCYYS